MSESGRELPSWWVPELSSFFPPGAVPYLERRFGELQEQLAELPAGVPIRAIEIGAHRGAFLVGLERTHTEGLVVGIEKRPKYVRLANERLAKHKLDRARMLRSDARLVVTTSIPLESLDAVYVTFPDPWWKDSHADRRILDPLFLRVLARRLKPGGRLYVKSDVFPYLYWVRASAEVSGAFRPLPPEKWPDERTWTLTTRERKCMRSALPFGRTYFERAHDFDASPPDEPELAADFPNPELPDPLELIKGAPPLDREARRQRAELGKTTQQKELPE